jgi:hypothetical protein
MTGAARAAVPIVAAAARSLRRAADARRSTVCGLALEVPVIWEDGVNERLKLM